LVIILSADGSPGRLGPSPGQSGTPDLGHGVAAARKVTIDMRWFKKLPWSRQSSKDYAEILLGFFLGRKPDPINLEYYTSLIYKRASFTKILGEITQNQEYKSNFGFRKTSGVVNRPCVWAGEKYHAYKNETEIESILAHLIQRSAKFEPASLA
jgi:hypothetical protein